MAKIEYFADLDMMGNQLINAVQEIVSELPGKVVAGRIIYNSKDGSFYMGLADAWKKIETPESISGAYATKTELEEGLATKLASDGTAVRATADADGNNIASTYETKTNVSTGLGKKLNTSQLVATLAGNVADDTKIPSAKLVDATFVKKDGDKVLSDNNYTDGEVAKVANLPADTNTVLGTKLTGTKATGIDDAGATAFPVASVVKTALGLKLDANKVETTVGTSDDKIPTSKAVGTAIKNAVASAYKVMGSVEAEGNLPSGLGADDTGKVYNIKKASSYGGAGTNVVWTGSAWDALGGTVDLSSYATKSYVDGKESALNSAISGKVAQDAYDTKIGQIDTALGTKVEKLSSKPTQGTYTQITINAEGQVTAGANALTTSDIKSGVFDKARLPTDVAYVPAVKDVPAQPSAGTPIVIAHGLGRMPVAVELFKADGTICQAQIQKDATNITLTFSSAVLEGAFKVSFI